MPAEGLFMKGTRESEAKAVRKIVFAGNLANTCKNSELAGHSGGNFYGLS